MPLFEPRPARIDALTGLLRRDAFDLEYRRLASNFSALIMVDCDHFKNVNDTMGHATGDLVLKDVASIVNSCIRTVDVACRWGGDEFVVLLPRTNLEEAQLVAERMRRKTQASILHGVTLSVGLIVTHVNESLISAVKRCDDAMYLAKRSGRNAVVFV